MFCMAPSPNKKKMKSCVGHFRCFQTKSTLAALPAPSTGREENDGTHVVSFRVKLNYLRVESGG